MDSGLLRGLPHLEGLQGRLDFLLQRRKVRFPNRKLSLIKKALFLVASADVSISIHIATYYVPSLRPVDVMYTFSLKSITSIRCDTNCTNTPSSTVILLLYNTNYFKKKKKINLNILVFRFSCSFLRGLMSCLCFVCSIDVKV